MVTQIVEVYWNLHKRCFSIRDAKSRKVIAHAPSVMLSHVTFRVSENGRQRVLRERRKNIHAVVRGTWIRGDVQPFDLLEWSIVAYDPYKAGTFVTCWGTPIHSVTFAYLETWLGKAKVNVLATDDANAAFTARWNEDRPLFKFGGMEPDYDNESLSRDNPQ